MDTKHVKMYRKSAILGNELEEHIPEEELRTV